MLWRFAGELTSCGQPAAGGQRSSASVRLLQMREVLVDGANESGIAGIVESDPARERRTCLAGRHRRVKRSTRRAATLGGSAVATMMAIRRMVRRVSPVASLITSHLPVGMRAAAMKELCFTLPINVVRQKCFRNYITPGQRWRAGLRPRK